MLLADNIEITIPLVLTKDDYDAYAVAGISIDLTQAVDAGNEYWFYDLTYEITDTAKLDLPLTGNDTDWLGIMVRIAIGLLALAAILTLRKTYLDVRTGRKPEIF